MTHFVTNNIHNYKTQNAKLKTSLLLISSHFKGLNILTRNEPYMCVSVYVYVCVSICVSLCVSVCVSVQAHNFHSFCQILIKPGPYDLDQNLRYFFRLKKMLWWRHNDHFLCFAKLTQSRFLFNFLQNYRQGVYEFSNVWS